MDKVIVTGGAGFIGSHLVDKLIAENFDVSVIDNLTTGKKENVNRRARFFKADIRAKTIPRLINKIKPQYIFHLAAQASVPVSLAKPLFDAEVNVLGSINVLEAAKATRIKKFIFVSTGGAIYGDASLIPTPETEPAKPLSPYGEAKLTIERYLEFYQERFGLPYIVLRLANVYGPRQDASWESGVISIFIRQLLEKKILSVHGDGKQTRDFVYVDDLAAALLLALKHGRGIYNIGTGIETSVIDLVRILGNIAGYPPKVQYTKARGMEDVRFSALSASLAKRELGWQPKFSLAQGLAETYKWFEETKS